MQQNVRFDDLGLIAPLLAAVREEGYATPTPIQTRAIPPVIAGRDLLGLAQTGTGKTAAFALPILQRLAAAPPPRGHRPTRALILTPTRELASQIGDSFSTYGRHVPLRNAVIFGGVGIEPQKQILRAGVDVLIATPGRLLDLAGQGFVKMESLEVFVLDEADRMLDMGFIHDVKRVIALLPRKRQTLFFSATMPREAQELADVLLRDPETVAVTPPSTTVEKIDQEVLFVDKNNKRALLLAALDDKAMKRVLVFTRTKHGANRVAEHLTKSGVQAEAIHGNKSQGARERALAAFKAGKMRVLVATDIAARGIDIDDISHVVNFDLPEVPETYVHRIGRTARAGASGFAMSFCDIEERELLHMVEKTTRQTIPVVTGHPYEPGWASQPYRPTGRPPMNLGKQEARERRDEERRGGGGGGGHGGHAPRGHSPRTGHPPASQTRDGHAQPRDGGGGGGGGGGSFGGGGGGGGNRGGRRRGGRGGRGGGPR
ncbi:MAG TPA: DEAD/DEAH box helicase [Kofleriaceae bacterium]|jgi:ATP-dependent RNA helicase RhlE|nr:DEAD/DEAH box helicase [Kofleriaceae bacterium]